MDSTIIQTHRHFDSEWLQSCLHKEQNPPVEPYEQKCQLWPPQRVPFTHFFHYNFIYIILRYRWVDMDTYIGHMTHLKKCHFFTVPPNRRARLRLGFKTCLPWYWICLNPNLQVDKVGWHNQTIPCFLLSTSTLFQFKKEHLYTGWCRIWCCRCQTLIPFVGWCACSCQTRKIFKLRKS